MTFFGCKRQGSFSIPVLDVYLRTRREQRLHDLEVQFEYTEAARDFLISQGFDANLGARPLRRAIQTYLEDPLSEKMLIGDLKKGTKIQIDAGDNRLVFEVEKSEVTP